MKKFKYICLILILFFISLFGFIIYNNKIETVSYTTFLEKVENSKIDTVYLTDSENMKFREKDLGKVFVTTNPRAENFKENMLKKNINVKEKLSISSTLTSIFSLSFIILLCFYVYKNFNKSKKSVFVSSEFKREESKSVYFKDIAGNEEAKENAKDIIDFLKNPEKYKKIGARVPKGIIFYGEPGTGKTLMAKAIANEANVPFYSTCGADFVEMYVGVGASRIRSLFKKAKENKRAVIFIDEIDAIGKKRSVSSSGNSEEKDQTLNALLSEMSGFSSEEEIIVIATTNRLEILDEALLRAGRFDRHIQISLPDLSGRKKILEFLLKDKVLSQDLINSTAKKTVYFSGAALENLVNEASIIAVKEGFDKIDKNHLEKAYIKILAGDAKKDRTDLRQEDLKIAAFHEAGHAILAKVLNKDITISKISIIPTTKGIGGFCLNIFKDKQFYSKKDLKAQIMINYGGRIAEEIIFGEENITTGAYNDIEKATNIIKDYVSKYCMISENSILNENILYENISNNHNREYYEKVSKELYKKAKDILIKNKQYLYKLSNILIENETIDEEEINQILKGICV